MGSLCLFGIVVLRWSNKYVVLDCPTDMAKDIVVSHVRDITLGKRTYHYLLSGLVSLLNIIFLLFFTKFVLSL